MATAVETGEGDDVLVRRAQAGDPDAFGRLVERYMRRAYYSALSLVGTREDALDLSQEAFARAYRARRTIDPDRPFYAWLYQILRRLCFNFLRDRQTLTILLLMPLVQVVLFGFALRSDVRDIRVIFVDASPDAATLALRARFGATRQFDIVGVLATTRAVEPMFRRGAADLAVVFDQDFGARVARGEPAPLQLLLDASDPNTGMTVQSYARGVIAAQEADWTRARGGIRIVSETRMRFNPTLESVNLFVPGLIALVLTLVSALMTAISLSREKERGTFEVLLVSPLRPWQIIIGKVLPYLGLAFAMKSHCREFTRRTGLSCEVEDVGLFQITRSIDLRGPLTDEQRTRLFQIADRCPVHRTLEAAFADGIRSCSTIALSPHQRR